MSRRATGIGSAIYLPLIPEAVLLVCTRLGSMHNVVLDGFTAHALRYRIAYADAKLLITSDRKFWRSKLAPPKKADDEAAAPDTNGTASPVNHVLVMRHNWNDEHRLCCLLARRCRCPQAPNTPRSRSTPSSHCF